MEFVAKCLFLLLTNLQSRTFSPLSFHCDDKEKIVRTDSTPTLASTRFYCGHNDICSTSVVLLAFNPLSKWLQACKQTSHRRLAVVDISKALDCQPVQPGRVPHSPKDQISERPRGRRDPRSLVIVGHGGPPLAQILKNLFLRLSPRTTQPFYQSIKVVGLS